MPHEYLTVGKKKSTIDVRISYRIIQLFSEGLYSSPNKAVEELVSNAFDAGATNVHVVISPDLGVEAATIAVFDDGIGMGETGLHQHWLIGVSNKRALKRRPRDRKQIGKFGIGKLATYVLAKRLTHLSKYRGKYYAVSMDYSQIPTGEAGGIYSEKQVRLPLRALTAKQAREALSPWLSSSKPGYKAIKLFGPDAAKTWTVAIMSDLKDMATEIQIGRLRWILQTAMPLRDDFNLFLNGVRVSPSKLAAKRVGKWVLGKDIKALEKPAPDNLQVTETEDEGTFHRYGLTHPALGRITGYAEVYEDLLTTGKSTEIERSHGFFVYVLGRLVNINDEYFGIDRNLLRHGTFSRFRMAVHIDRLDDELRSSRETVREGPLVNTARNILRAMFNYARLRLEEHEARVSTGAGVARRAASTPKTLTQTPIAGVIRDAVLGKFSPRYISYPQGLSRLEREEFLAEVDARTDSPEGLVRDAELVELSQEDGVAILDGRTGTLRINMLHPFVAYFLDEYEDKKRSLPLELLALSEVLTEAYLYEAGITEDLIHDVMAQRDELLRYLARSSGKRNAYLVAQDLLDASSDGNALERELVAAFDSMGFDAVPLGGKNKPDGIADARLPAMKPGQVQRYRVSLEAKSKEVVGATVSAKSVGVSTIARQRDDYECDHALVVGPNFPTTQGEMSALVKEIKSDRENKERTITLIRITDLARLVRLQPVRHIDLKRLRELFEQCTTPEECKAWVDRVETEPVGKPRYREVLEAIALLQEKRPSELVEYAAIVVALDNTGVLMTKDDVLDLCKALSRLAPEYVDARKQSVHLSQRPDKILAAIAAAIKSYPDGE